MVYIILVKMIKFILILIYTLTQMIADQFLMPGHQEHIHKNLQFVAKTTNRKAHIRIYYMSKNKTCYV